MDKIILPFSLVVLLNVLFSFITVTNAQISSCAAMPCKNGGTCSNQPSLLYGYRCTCLTGFSGLNCDTNLNSIIQGGANNVNQVVTNAQNLIANAVTTRATTTVRLTCAQFPCRNGGTCRASSNTAGYTCSCTANYEGTNCERTKSSGTAKNLVLILCLAIIIPVVCCCVICGICIFCCCCRNKKSDSGSGVFGKAKNMFMSKSQAEPTATANQYQMNPPNYEAGYDTSNYNANKY